MTYATLHPRTKDELLSAIAAALVLDLGCEVVWRAGERTVRVYPREAPDPYTLSLDEQRIAEKETDRAAEEWEPPTRHTRKGHTYH